MNKEVIGMEQFIFKGSSTEKVLDSLLKRIERQDYNISYNEAKGNNIAYCYRNKDVEKGYNVCISKDYSDDISSGLKAHELYHVSFNHLDIDKKQSTVYKTAISAILNNWETLEQSEFHKSLPKDARISKFLLAFSNIAQDLEINSTCFEDNWELFGSNLKKEYEEKLLKSGKEVVQDGESTLGLHPSKYNWEDKQSWYVYLLLILDNIEDFMEETSNEDLQQALDNLTRDENGENPQQGQESSETSEIEKAIQEIIEEALKQIQEEASDNKVNGESDNESNEESSEEGSDESDTALGKLKSLQESNAQKASINNKESKPLNDILKKILLSKTRMSSKSDYTYYPIRNRYPSEVLVPKRQVKYEIDTSKCIIVIDVSGSVPSELISTALSTLKNNSQLKSAHDTKIILWSTRLEDEFLLGQMDDFTYGGGTEIAEGIKYAGKIFKKEQKYNHLIVISDFEDDLDDWVLEANKIKGINKTAICWESLRSVRMTNSFKQTFDVKSIKD